MTISWRKPGKKKPLPAIMDTGIGKAWYKLLTNEERKSYGLPEVEPRQEIPTEDIVALWECGASTAYIAKKYNVSVKTINMRLFGVDHLRPRNRDDIKTEDIVKLHEEGYGPTALAQKFDCSVTLINKRLERWRKNGKSV
jgi:uncharacterized protein (DUF433 family)